MRFGEDIDGGREFCVELGLGVDTNYVLGSNGGVQVCVPLLISGANSRSFFVLVSLSGTWWSLEGDPSNTGLVFCVSHMKENRRKWCVCVVNIVRVVACVRVVLCRENERKN